jgi:hypothetical protein
MKLLLLFLLLRLGRVTSFLLLLRVGYWIEESNYGKKKLLFHWYVE